jgi:dimethylsulfoniopropionate demethylase
MSSPKLNYSRRIRATPYTPRVEALSVSGYSVVNHTILPKGFKNSVEEDYWHLKKHVQIWDVGCQRQVEICGSDAAHLTQLMTPRDLTRAQIGQCLYAPMVDQNGGILNDPIILKLAEDRFWLSIADADMLLWAKGLALGMELDVVVEEPDVWPLSIQGPKSDDLVSRVFGSSVREIGFFKFQKYPFMGRDLVVARTGYSKQGGFEIYMDDFSQGAALWDTLWKAGEGLNLTPGSPNLIERVEGGLLSFGNDMTRENNPLECNMDRYCQLDGSIHYIGLEALQKIAQSGPKQRVRGVIFDGEKCPPCQHPWPIRVDSKQIGYITTAIWSPRFEQNVALAMIDNGYQDAETRITVQASDTLFSNGKVVDLPMQGPH